MRKLKISSEIAFPARISVKKCAAKRKLTTVISSEIAFPARKDVSVCYCIRKNVCTFLYM